MREKVFQMFITGTGKNFDYFLQNGIGGVIFFSDDIKTEVQFIQLINKIKSTLKKHSKPAAFLSIDQEGGRVERTENLHTKRYLSPKYAYEQGIGFLKSQTDNMLSELSKYGINMNFAPCLDVNTNPNNPIIGERAFSDKPDEVCNAFDTVFPVYAKYNIISVVKHFPGHGDADKDSHKELPKIDLSLSEMENTHIYPFRHAINKGIDFIMAAHLSCKCFDKDEVPTSLSANCINYLKTNLGYKGLIVSDDMYMKGLSKYSMTEACIRGIKSGINIFIYRNSSDDTLDVIEDIVQFADNDVELKNKITESYNKILKAKQKYQLI